MTVDRRRIVLWGVLALAAVALGLGTRLFYDRMEAGAIGTPDLGGPFEVVDHDGRTVTEADFEGKPSLLFFGFTHCPEICPTTVFEIEGWMQALGDRAEEVNAWFVTVDPERDTPAILKDYLEYQSDHVIGLTGEPEAVWDMARAWRVYWQKGEADERGNYNLDHSTMVYLLDEDGTYADLIRYGEPAVSAIAKIEALL